MPSTERPTEAEEAELRKLLRPRKRPPIPKQPNLWLGRHIVMTQRDVDAFVRAIHARYPSMVFLERRSFRDDDGFRLVERPLANDRFVTGVLPDGDWSAAACCALEEGAPGQASFPETCFEFEVDGEVRDHEFENGRKFRTRHHGYLRGTYLRNDKETLRFIRSILWISRKITTNRLKVLHWQTGETRWPSESGPYCGFDALQWCLQSPYHAIDGHYRPTDDWVMPDSPWYD
jgi:hypothetical protein